MARFNRQERFFLYMVVLIVISLGIVVFTWNGTGFYQRSYTPMVERAREQGNPIMHSKSGQTKNNRGSSQPRPAGFREGDIEKKRGSGYSTY